jgi:dihydroorotase
MAHLLESFGALDNLDSFVSKNGRSFYKCPSATDRIVKLRKVQNGALIEEKYESGSQSLVPFWAGKRINWEIQ